MGDMQFMIQVMQNFENKINEAIKASGPEMVTKLTKTVFDNPGVESIQWDQYTPYFNDGDPCEFSVHEPAIKIAGWEEIAEFWADYPGGFFSSWSIGYVIKQNPDLSIPEGLNLEQLTEDLNNLAKTICSTQGQKILYTLFGDHVRVVVTPDGNYEVEDIDHD